MFRDKKNVPKGFAFHSLLYPSHVLKASEGAVSDSEEVSRQLLIIPHYFIVCCLFLYYQAAELKYFLVFLFSKHSSPTHSKERISAIKFFLSLGNKQRYFLIMSLCCQHINLKQDRKEQQVLRVRRDLLMFHEGSQITAIQLGNRNTKIYSKLYFMIMTHKISVLCFRTLWQYSNYAFLQKVSLS